MKYAVYFKEGDRCVLIPYHHMSTFDDGTKGFVGNWKEHWPIREHREHFIRAFNPHSGDTIWVFAGNLSWSGRTKARIKAALSHWVFALFGIIVLTGATLILLVFCLITRMIFRI